MQLVFRFIVGGLVVSFFAVVGDALKPKSFAGLFGSAPSGRRNQSFSLSISSANSEKIQFCILRWKF